MEILYRDIAERSNWKKKISRNFLYNFGQENSYKDWF
jgi:hypothetical protein